MQALGAKKTEPHCVGQWSGWCSGWCDIDVDNIADDYYHGDHGSDNVNGDNDDSYG
jgi:hypothetical protein